MNLQTVTCLKSNNSILIRLQRSTPTSLTPGYKWIYDTPYCVAGSGLYYVFLLKLLKKSWKNAENKENANPAFLKCGAWSSWTEYNSHYSWGGILGRDAVSLWFLLGAIAEVWCTFDYASIYNSRGYEDYATYSIDL